jgi:hypothetical protein
MADAAKLPTEYKTKTPSAYVRRANSNLEVLADDRRLMTQSAMMAFLLALSPA